MTKHTPLIIRKLANNADQYEVGGEVFEAKELFMLLVSKHRNGECGEIPLRFIGSETKLCDIGQSDNYVKAIPSFSNEDENDIPF